MDHTKDLKELDATQVKIIQLQKQLMEAQKTIEGGATMVATTTAFNYWPHGIGLKEQLMSKDKAAYRL